MLVVGHDQLCRRKSRCRLRVFGQWSECPFEHDPDPDNQSMDQESTTLCRSYCSPRRSQQNRAKEGWEVLTRRGQPREKSSIPRTAHLNYSLNVSDVDVIGFSDGNVRSMTEGGPFAYDLDLFRPHSGNATGELEMPRGNYLIYFVGHNMALDGSPGFFQLIMTKYWCRRTINLSPRKEY